MRNKINGRLLIGVILAACPALAQVVTPGALQQLRIEEDERQRRMERLDQQQSAEPKVEVPAEGPAIKPDPDAVPFFVRRIQFTKSEIIRTDELEKLAADYQGREQTLPRLQALAAAVNDEYRKRGVVTAQAVIPPQDVSAGIVEIRLVEGRLGNILLKGSNSTSTAYVLKRIGMKPGDLVDLQRLERDLLRFNRTNDVQLQAQLAPGTAFSTTDLRLFMREPSRHSLRTFVDDGGGFSTGEYRGGVTYSNRSLFGYRDDLSLSTVQSDGQHSYSIRYGLPFNRSGGRVALAYYQDHTEIRHGSYSSLDISGESRSVVFSLRQPVYLGRFGQIDLLGGAKARRNKTWISDIFVAGTDTIDGSIGIEAQRADSHGYWVGSYSFTTGSARAEERSDYWHGRGWVHRRQYLTDRWSAVGSFSWQNTARRMLPASEQFIIGGEGTVRGLPVGTYGGNSGLTLSAELHHPIVTIFPGDGDAPLEFNGFLFFDFGHVRIYRPPDSTAVLNEQLSCIGWGFNLAFSRYAVAKAGFSYGMNAIPEAMGRQNALFFQVTANIF
ncbi:MAG: ShlB/FhaC/HecB family hemolysin secretion/activation protein [Acidobacteria bacterium]|mgnify:CR=1 FL=1|nr:ShlB/FhaC/HecB family hemolysin secretion/activation protein [Acidobacteriota bacterium]